LQQFCNLLFREDVRLESLMRLRKQDGIGNETVGFGPAAIETEVVNVEHPSTSNAGSPMLLSLTPSLKRRRTEVQILGRLLVEESVQEFEGMGCTVETLA
jgi:hypothetical protein